MHVEIVHEFPCSPDRFFEIIESDALEAEIAARSTSKRELLHDRMEGEVRVRAWRITPTREWPGVIKKLLGNHVLSYVQTSRSNRKAHRLEWTIEVEKAGNRAEIGGTLVAEPIPTGCRRVVRGDITIRVPFVGRKVEANIARDVERTYARSHRLVLGLLTTPGSQ